MLDIYPLLMVFVLVVFFVLLYQLNGKLYVPLLKFMDERDAAIAKDMEAAKSMGGNSDELTAQAEANIDEAKNSAAALRQEAIETSRAKAAALVVARQGELDAKQEKFMEKLSEEQEALRSGLLSQIPLVKESLKAKFGQL